MRQHRISIALSGLGGVILAAVVAAGCGGGGGGGGGGGASPIPPTSPTPVQPTGNASVIRPDFRTGVSVPSVSLQDQKVHVYAFPATAGASFTLTFDTTPSGQTISLTVLEGIPNGTATPTQNMLVTTKDVTTPCTEPLTGTGESTINVAVFDAYQKNLTLSSLSVQLLLPQANTSSITAFVQIAGDSFAGLGAYNDLQTTADQQQFVGALLNGVNAIWAQTGVQINVGSSGFRKLSSAQVQATDPNLVVSGFTVMDPGDGTGNNVPAKAWGNLGIDASDPTYGRSVDIFVVQRSLLNSAGADVLGVANGVKLSGQGGIFEGKGTEHSLAFGLFDVQGKPRSVTELTKTLAHELGHFLSLAHTTEQNFTPDDLPDTPFATRANDTDRDGKLTPLDTLSACPDFQNLMFLALSSSAAQTTLTADQGAAVRAYLALRRH